MTKYSPDMMDQFKIFDGRYVKWSVLIGTCSIILLSLIGLAYSIGISTAENKSRIEYNEESIRLINGRVSHLEQDLNAKCDTLLYLLRNK